MFIKNIIPSQDYGYQIDVLPKVDEVPTEMPSSPTLAVGTAASKVDARDPAEPRVVKARNILE